ncbi:MAG: hypothetical protein ACUVR8_08965 [Acidobacteriota bacterium]
MTPEQFDTINRLFLLTFQVGDRLGSESSNPAQLLLTLQPSLETCQVYFPAAYTLEPLEAELWQEHLAEAPALAEIACVLASSPLTYGLYRQDEVSWWVCAFWAAEAQLGTNLLFRAHRVET